MYASPPGDNVALWLSKAAGVTMVAMILTISVLVVVDVVATDDIELVQDMTSIPRWVYLTLLVVLFIASFLWLMSEWYMGRWNMYKAVYNLGAIYGVMIITTFVLLMFHLLRGRALFDFLPMIPIFYIPFGFIFSTWAYITIPNVKATVQKYYAQWMHRRAARQ